MRTASSSEVWSGHKWIEPPGAPSRKGCVVSDQMAKAARVSSLALAMISLTTHPFRDGVPFLLLIETPATFGCALRFSHMLHRNFLLILSPSWFAVCGHHPSPRIAIVFSLLSSAPNFSKSHSSIFLISPCNTSLSSLYISHSPTVYCVATEAGGGGCTHVMHGRSRMIIDPRIPTLPGRSTSGFHQPGRHR